MIWRIFRSARRPGDRVKVTAYLVWLAVSLAAAQLNAADPDNLLTGYSLTSWTHGDGVPLGTVYAVGQDRDGYLWIASDAGLLRFDGLRFTPWETISDSPLPNSPVSALCIAHDGSLWVGFAEGGGVRHLRDGRIVPGPQAPLGSVVDIVEDHEGSIWAVSDGAIFRLKHEAWQRMILPPDIREPLPLHPYVNARGQLWLGASRGLYRRVDETDSFERLQGGYTWGVSQDANGTLWTTDIV